MTLAADFVETEVKEFLDTWKYEGPTVGPTPPEKEMLVALAKQIIKSYELYRYYVNTQVGVKPNL